MEKVELTSVKDNLTILRNWQAHILFTMLKTSGRLGKFPPIVKWIFKERFPDNSVFDDTFVERMKEGYVSFTDMEVERLIAYVARVFNLDVKKLRRAIKTEIKYTPTPECMSQEDLETISLFGIGIVALGYQYPKN